MQEGTLSESGKLSTDRPPLSRERVLVAAMRLADAGGIESLSMRRLGQELGVEAMSLYNHVANKNDILSGILEMTMAKIDLPNSGGDWKAEIRKTAVSSHSVLLRHPWACSLMMSTDAESPSRMRWMEAVLRTFRSNGFSARLTHYAYHALDSHITGFTLWIVSLPAHGEDLLNLATAYRQTLVDSQFPYVIEHIDYHLNEPEDEQSAFEFGLDLILDGLERIRDAEEGGGT